MSVLIPPVPYLLSHPHAMIASGTWKAKKHKEMAAHAREQWAALRSKIGKQLWIRHVKEHSGHHWNNKADRLAERWQAGA